MLLQILDANGVKQNVLAHGIEAVVDQSGVIVATGVAQIATPALSTRAGWLFQNLGTSSIWINDLGTATAGSGSFMVPPNGVFPPNGYPLTQNAISILGTLSTQYTLRIW